VGFKPQTIQPHSKCIYQLHHPGPLEVVVVVVVVVVCPVCKIEKNEEFCVTTHVLGACGGAVG